MTTGRRRSKPGATRSRPEPDDELVGDLRRLLAAIDPVPARALLAARLALRARSEDTGRRAPRADPRPAWRNRRTG